MSSSRRKLLRDFAALNPGRWMVSLHELAHATFHPLQGFAQPLLPLQKSILIEAVGHEPCFKPVDVLLADEREVLPRRQRWLPIESAEAFSSLSTSGVWLATNLERVAPLLELGLPRTSPRQYGPALREPPVRSAPASYPKRDG